MRPLGWRQWQSRHVAFLHARDLTALLVAIGSLMLVVYLVGS